MPILAVNVSANPDALSVAGRTELLMKVTNLGKSDAVINSIEMSPSWNVLKLGKKEGLMISPNRTVLQTIPVKVPKDTSSGIYNLVIKLATADRDFDSSVSLTVNRIESLPLSDNIPLSILVLIFSWVITYSLGAWIITQQFQRIHRNRIVECRIRFPKLGILYLLGPILNIQITLELVQYDFSGVAAILTIAVV